VAEAIVAAGAIVAYDKRKMTRAEALVKYCGYTPEQAERSDWARAESKSVVKVSNLECVPTYKHTAVLAVLDERERELLELKGPCGNTECSLHYAHSGPCDGARAILRPDV